MAKALRASSKWRWFADQASEEPKLSYGGRISPFHSWSWEPQKHNRCAGYATPKPQSVPLFQNTTSSRAVSILAGVHRNKLSLNGFSGQIQYFKWLYFNILICTRNPPPKQISY